GHAGEPAYRTLADIKVKLLTQRDVQRTDTTPYRRGQRALDRHHVVAHGFEGFLGQPGVLVIDLGGFLASIDFHPGDLALARVGLLNGGIDHLDHHRTDVDTDTVTLDVGNDRIVRYDI